MNIQIDYQTLNTSSKRRIEKQYRTFPKRARAPRMTHKIVATLAVAMLAVLLVAQVALPAEFTADVSVDKAQAGEVSDPIPVDVEAEVSGPETVYVGEAVPLDPDADLSDVNPRMGGSGGGFLIK